MDGVGLKGVIKEASASARKAVKERLQGNMTPCF